MYAEGSRTQPQCGYLSQAGWASLCSRVEPRASGSNDPSKNGHRDGGCGPHREDLSEEYCLTAAHRESSCFGGSVIVYAPPFMKGGARQPHRVARHNQGSKHSLPCASPYDVFLQLLGRYVLAITNFLELRKGEVRRIPLLRGWVNKPSKIGDPTLLVLAKDHSFARCAPPRASANIPPKSNSAG